MHLSQCGHLRGIRCRRRRQDGRPEVHRRRARGGDDRQFDFNDTPTNPSKFGYGCLQVHDLAAKKTIFSFNHFNNARVACDVGIGTATTRHPDWTFSANAGAYKARRMSVWVK